MNTNAEKTETQTGMKKGVILLAYGAPGSMDDVRDFYIDVTGGRIPSDAMVNELKERYLAIGGKTPLLPVTQQKCDALSKKLGDDYKVYVGMRHWHPFIKDTVQQMKNDGITHAAAIVMAPHFSYMSIGKYHRFLDEAKANLDSNPAANHVAGGHPRQA
jgi:protoporphyrin/coproporphyrin ferrochelatase